MRLHTRLLLSYIVVLAVTLSVIGVALLLFLNARPAPPQNIYRELGAQRSIQPAQHCSGFARRYAPEPCERNAAGR